MLNHDRDRKEREQFRVLQGDCTRHEHERIEELRSLLQRKYEQIMSHTQDDLHGCCLLGKIEVTDARGNSIDKRRASWSCDDGEDAPHSKRVRKIAARSSLSPGSNSSDITTDQYMAAESSKSSCFDDACTLATTSRAQGGGETGASTSESVLAYRGFAEDVELHRAGVDLTHRQQQTSRERLLTQGFGVAEEESSLKQQQFISLGKAEDREQIAREEEVVRSKQPGKGIDYYGSQQQDSWLQLGLGPSSSATSPKAAHRQQMANPQVIEYASDDQDEVDVSRQPKPVLHLFPSESVHQIPKYSPHSPGRMLSSPHAAAGSHASVGEADIYSGGESGVRFDNISYRAQEAPGFLKPMKDTQLGTSSASAAAHGTMEQQRRLAMFADSLFPFREQGAGLISDSPLHHAAYGYGDAASFQSSQVPFEDKRFFGGGYFNPVAAASSGKRMQQDAAVSWKSEGLLPPFATVYVPTAGPFHPPPRVFPNQPPEDWQQSLIKRLGGSMQLQSIFPKAAEEDLQQHRRSNIRDLQHQWNTQDMRAGSWSRQHLLGSQEMPPFSFSDLSQAWHSSPAPAAVPPPPPRLSLFQHVVGDASSRERRNLSPVKDHDIWFLLRAHGNEDSEQWLPQIPKGYLRVKDGAVPVSYVKKYLVHKLGLSCESEVEISCRGQILQPSLSLQHVRDVIWYSSATVASAAAADEQRSGSAANMTPTTSASASPLSKNVVMELNYRRQLHTQFGPSSS